MINPYLNYSDALFVGRKQIVSRIEELVLQNASVSLIGEHRIGKTVISQHIKMMITEKYNYILCCDYTLNDLSSCAALFRKLAYELSEVFIADGEQVTVDKLRNNALLTGEDKSEQDYDFLKSLLRLHARTYPVKKIVVFIDEFDTVLDKVTKQEKGVENLLFIRRLRELIIMNNISFSCVLVSRRSLLHIESQLNGLYGSDISNLDGVCESIYIPPFNISELHELIGLINNQWVPSDEEQDLLFQYSGGHPHIAAKILGKALPVRSIELGFNEAKHYIISLYEKTWGLLKNDGLHTILLQYMTGLFYINAPEKTSRLKKYGLIREPITETEKKHNVDYVPYSSYFGEYILLKSHDDTVWEEWAKCEQELRDIVNIVLQKHFGECWMDNYKSCLQGPTCDTLIHMFDDLKLLQSRENKHFDNAAMLLDYSYPCNLREIIFNQALWPFFKPILGDDKKIWHERFEFFQIIRAPVGHNRLNIIGDIEKAKLTLYADSVNKVYCLLHKDWK